MIEVEIIALSQNSTIILQAHQVAFKTIQILEEEQGRACLAV
jgi:hypothetical protein